LLRAFHVFEPGKPVFLRDRRIPPGFPVQSRFHRLLAAHAINILLAKTMPSLYASIFNSLRHNGLQFFIL
jgi:hypothetical protein